MKKAIVIIILLGLFIAAGYRVDFNPSPHEEMKSEIVVRSRTRNVDDSKPTSVYRRDFETSQESQDFQDTIKDSDCYPKLAKVIGIEDSVAIVEDSDGFTWGFSYEDYGISVFPGEYVAMMMYNNGTTDSIFDDVIVDVTD